MKTAAFDGFSPVNHCLFAYHWEDALQSHNFRRNGQQMTWAEGSPHGLGLIIDWAFYIKTAHRLESLEIGVIPFLSQTSFDIIRE